MNTRIRVCYRGTSQKGVPFLYCNDTILQKLRSAIMHLSLRLLLHPVQRIAPYSYHFYYKEPTGIKPIGSLWSGRRGSNSRHPPWQGGILQLNYPRLYFLCYMFKFFCQEYFIKLYFKFFVLHIHYLLTFFHNYLDFFYFTFKVLHF